MAATCTIASLNHDTDAIMKLSNRTIFITGGTSGIGRGIAEALHRLGNQVIIGGRRQTLLDEITKANPGMRSVAVDVTDAASIEAAAKTLIRDFPRLDVLFNNAGIMPFDDVSKPVDDAVAQSIITTNLLGPIRMTSALIEHLKRQPSAVILHNTSVLAFVPLAVAGVYSATKAALHSLTLSQRFMLRDTSVRVQEIAPPWVSTDLIGQTDDPRAMRLEAFIEQTVKALAGDEAEVLVEQARPLRNNAGPNEHAFVMQFNQAFLDPASVPA
jgi:uncharacterized oxidoreductase